MRSTTTMTISHPTYVTMSVNDMHKFGNSLPSEPRGDAILETIEAKFRREATFEL